MRLTMAAAFPVLVLLLKATLALGAAALVALVLKRSSAGVRHVVWLTVLSGILAMPMMEAWPPFRLEVLPTSFPLELVETGSAAADVTTGSGTAGPGIVPVSVYGLSGSPEPARNASAAGGVLPGDGAGPVLSPLELMAAVWAGVMLLLLARLVAGALIVRRIVARAVPVESPEMVEVLYEVADRIGLERSPRVVISDDIGMPFATGLLSATIVLPRNSYGWSREQLTPVLIHELAHVRRRDLIGHTIGRIACALYWFHPMVWMAARKLRDAGERACDDLALELGTVPSGYAEHLLDLVTGIRRDATPSVAMALASRSEFEGRMLAILDPTVARRHPTRFQAVALGGVLAGLMLVLAAAAPAGHDGAATLAGDHPVERPAPPVAVDPPVADPVAAETPTAAPATADPAGQVSRQDGSKGDAPGPAFDQYDPDTLRLVRALILDSQRINLAAERLSRTAEELGLAIAEDLLDLLCGASEQESPRGGGSGRPAGTASADPAGLARVMLSDPDPRVRLAAAWGLKGNAAGRGVVEALGIAASRDLDPEVRKMAVWSMSSIRSDEPVVFLAGALGDSSAAVREMAAWALGQIGSEDGAVPLTRMLATEPDPAVQATAAWALGQIRPDLAPPELGHLLTSSDEKVVTAAAWTIGEIGDRAMAVPVAEALRRPQARQATKALIRAAAATGLGDEELRLLLQSGDTEVRLAATRLMTGSGWSEPWPWPQPRVVFAPSISDH